MQRQGKARFKNNLCICCHQIQIVSRMLAVAKEARVRFLRSHPWDDTAVSSSCRRQSAARPVCGGEVGLAVPHSDRNEIFLTSNAVFWDLGQALPHFLPWASGHDRWHIKPTSLSADVSGRQQPSTKHRRGNTRYTVGQMRESQSAGFLCLDFHVTVEFPKEKEEREINGKKGTWVQKCSTACLFYYSL